MVWRESTKYASFLCIPDDTQFIKEEGLFVWSQMTRLQLS